MGALRRSGLMTGQIKVGVISNMDHSIIESLDRKDGVKTDSGR